MGSGSWQVVVSRWQVACGPTVWGSIGHQLGWGGENPDIGVEVLVVLGVGVLSTFYALIASHTHVGQKLLLFSYSWIGPHSRKESLLFPP